MDLSLRTRTLKSIAWGSVLLCWAGWVIALSGLSALQHDCGSAHLPEVQHPDILCLDISLSSNPSHFDAVLSLFHVDRS